MAKTVIMLFLLVIPLSSVVAAERSADGNLTIVVTSGFPKEIRYITLKENIVSLLSPCRRRNTSGRWDAELLEQLERNRRTVGRIVLSHLVDEEFMPKRRRRGREEHRVVIDPFAFGVSRVKTTAFAKGYAMKVTLEGHVLVALMLRGSAQYSVAIWRWDNKAERSKSCGFSYHR